jgi:hypothetical protein
MIQRTELASPSEYIAAAVRYKLTERLRLAVGTFFKPEERGTKTVEG